MSIDENKNLVDNTNEFYRDSQSINSNKFFQDLIKEIEEVKTFIRDLDYLNFNRSFQIDKQARVFSIDHILSSTYRTLHSIKICCECCNLADVYILIRKYRDDLFFYLYILCVNSNSDNGNDPKISKDEGNIIDWLNNDLSNLNINQVLSYIAKTKNVNEVMNKYKLQSSFKSINNELNNFVHANGISYYNKNYQYYNLGDKINDISEDIKYKINYITTSFLLVLILVRGDYISATDYVDNLECGYNPIEGSQYWVAPFITEFINSRISLVSDECRAYLKEYSLMDIE
ncbi:MAG: hypothetical protein E6583_00800 [Clostridium sp.]|nr:hypothetical protein [Clostridium sp.]